MRLAVVIVIGLLGVTAGFADTPASAPSSLAAGPRIMRLTLENGLDVSIITINHEIAFSMFTFIPGGLMTDEPGHVLWSRLIERLSTQLEGISDGYASTDHLRLETWSQPQKWKETMVEHARLLQGIDFSEHALKVYREDVEISSAFDESDLRAWDLAQAFFAQALRHGLFKIDLTRLRQAELPEVEAYRQQRWGVMPGTRLCVISGLEDGQHVVAG